MFPKSLRWRLQLWHGLLLLFVLAGFGWVAHYLARESSLRAVDQRLSRRMTEALESLRRGGVGGRSADSDTLRSIIEPHGPARDEDIYGALSRSEGEAPIYTKNAPGAVPLPVEREPRTELTRMRGPYREIYHVTPPGSIILMGRDVSDELAERRRLGWILTATAAGVLLFGLAVGGWLISRAIRPIGAIARTAGFIAKGNLEERIPVRDAASELGRLAETLNATFSQLEAAFAQQKRFTADAAHELRTPLTVVLTQTQMALARPRGADEYRQFFETVQRAAQRMRLLVEALLDLAKLDSNTEPIHTAPCDLASLAADAIELMQPLAEKRRITVNSDLAAAPCSADANRLSQVLVNFLTNAINYSREGGEVLILTAMEADWAVASVTDSGSGIPAQDQPHVFDRFYRADASRNSRSGGAGLGLAISKAIVEAHGGAIEVTSDPGHGSAFTIRIPTAAIPPPVDS